MNLCIIIIINYKLLLQCVRHIALDALFGQLLTSDGIQKLAVLGGGCSPATEPTAEVSHYWNLTQV